MSGARACLPREHGLWCWAGVPLVVAVLAVPSAGSALASASLLALFGAANAARVGVRGVATVAGTISLGLGLGAASLLAPLPWMVTWAGVAVGALGATCAVGRRVGTRIPHHTRYELAAILGGAAAGGGIIVAGGGRVAAAASLVGALVAWEVIGLWWVRGQLSKVLPERVPWRGGIAWGVAAVMGSAALAWVAGAPMLAAIPALYLLRIALTAPVTSARDARRIGLTEAAWTLAAVSLAAVSLGERLSGSPL